MTEPRVFYYRQAAAEKMPASEAIPKPYFAGFWIRFFAYIIDLIAAGSIQVILLTPLFTGVGLPKHSSLFSLYGLASALLFLAYFIVFTKLGGQTLGKMLLGIKVIRLDRKPLTFSNVLFREGLLRYLQKVILPLYLVVAFTPQKQGIADLLENTTVVHVGYLELETKA